MPVIEVNLPHFLLRDISHAAYYHEIETDAFILLALAEKIGEFKTMLVEKALKENVWDEETLIQKLPSILKVIALDDFKVHIEFASGLAGDYDVKPLINRGGVFSALANPVIFSTVKIGEGGAYIKWYGDITIGCDTLFAALLLLDKEKSETKDSKGKLDGRSE